MPQYAPMTAPRAALIDGKAIAREVRSLVRAAVDRRVAAGGRPPGLAVVMAAVPNDPTDAYALPRAQKAGEINITAAKSFNRGLRSVYFALAACGWLLGPYALIGATALTALVLWRREFASRSRAVLMGMDDGMGHTQT